MAKRIIITIPLGRPAVVKAEGFSGETCRQYTETFLRGSDVESDQTTDEAIQTDFQKHRVETKGWN